MAASLSGFVAVSLCRYLEIVPSSRKSRHPGHRQPPSRLLKGTAYWIPSQQHNRCWTLHLYDYVPWSKAGVNWPLAAMRLSVTWMALFTSYERGNAGLNFKLGPCSLDLPARVLAPDPLKANFLSIPWTRFESDLNDCPRVRVPERAVRPVHSSMHKGFLTGTGHV